MKISRDIRVDIELSPENIADCFCDLHGNEQAIFFNRVSEVTATWGSPFCFQLQNIVDSNILTREGKEIMCQIGEYSEEDI
jgi:hypothetical protein